MLDVSDAQAQRARRRATLSKPVEIRYQLCTEATAGENSPPEAPAEAEAAVAMVQTTHAGRAADGADSGLMVCEHNHYSDARLDEDEDELHEIEKQVRDEIEHEIEKETRERHCTVVKDLRDLHMHSSSSMAQAAPDGEMQSPGGELRESPPRVSSRGGGISSRGGGISSRGQRRLDGGFHRSASGSDVLVRASAALATRRHLERQIAGALLIPLPSLRLLRPLSPPAPEPTSPLARKPLSPQYCASALSYRPPRTGPVARCPFR